MLGLDDRSSHLRDFFARYVTARGKATDARILKGGGWPTIRSLRLDDGPPDETCWLAGDG